MNSLGDALADLRYALRTLRRRAFSTLIAASALALGLGATTLVFSMARAVLSIDLPYDQSDRLVVVWERTPIAGYEELPLSAEDYVELAQDRKVFDSLAVFEYVDLTLSGRGIPREVRATAAVPALFQVLRTEAALGRTFRLTDVDGGFVVLGHDFWHRELGGAADAVGQRLELNGRPHTVMGVLPSGFRFPFPLTWQGRTFHRGATEVFVPLHVDPDVARGDHSLLAVGRLQAGLSPGAAARLLGPRMEALTRSRPETHPPGLEVHLASAEHQAGGAVRPAIYLLALAVFLLLLIACGNVASLLLARATSRAKEMAVRGALGAALPRLARQLLAESLLLSLGASAAGLLMAAWGLKVISRLELDEVPHLAEVRLDAVGLGAGMVLALAVTLVFGLLPAFYAAQGGIYRHLRDAGPAPAASHGRRRLLEGLVVFEIALAVALLTTAGWAAASWRRLAEVDPGFDADGLVVLELPLHAEHYAEARHCHRRAAEIVDAVSALPNVETAGLGSYLPLAGQEDAAPYEVEDGVPRGLRVAPRLAARRQVTPGFLETLGVPLQTGRGLRWSDDTSAPRVVVVNRALADEAWSGRDPTGLRLTLDDPTLRQSVWWEVVGVVADIRDRRLDQRAEPTIFFPYAQIVSAPLGIPQGGRDTLARRLTLAARSEHDAESLLPDIERTVRSIDPGLALGRRSLGGPIRDVLGRYELNSVLLTSFAASALGLAAFGIFGVLTFLVAERRHELAIRAAVGARPSQLSGLVMRRTLALAALGAVFGLGAALALGRLLGSVLYGLEVGDPTVLFGVPAVLFTVAAASAFIPAQRAGETDTVGSLRAE